MRPFPFHGARTDAPNRTEVDRRDECRTGRLADRSGSSEPVALGSLGCRQAGSPLPQRSTLEQPALPGRARYGIRTVVNFQLPGKEMEIERALAARLGVGFVNLPMPGDGFGEEAQFRKVLEID